MQPADPDSLKPSRPGQVVASRRVAEEVHYPTIDLPQAASMERAKSSNGDLGKALKPAIEGVILDTLRENPKVVIDLVYPVLGKAIRRAIGSALAGLAASIEDKATSAFRLEGLRWRWQALRTKTPYAQIVMANSLVYEVEGVLLIHRATGILLAHVAQDVSEIRDHDLISSMLTAIEDFARDSFSMGDGDSLNSFSMGEQTMVVKSTPLLVLAAAVHGTVTGGLHELLDEVTEEVHDGYRSKLEAFDGMTNDFGEVVPLLERALKTEHSRKIPRTND